MLNMAPCRAMAQWVYSLKNIDMQVAEWVVLNNLQIVEEAVVDR